jgi:hypothetical protein
MVMTSQTVRLVGRVSVDDGIYVVSIDGTNWCTYHSDGIAALRDVPRMVVDYLNAYEQTGQIEERLSALGFDLPLSAELAIEIVYDLTATLMAASTLTERVPYSVSVGAASL